MRLTRALQRTASPPSVRTSREFVSAPCAPPPPRPSLSLVVRHTDVKPTELITRIVESDIKPLLQERGFRKRASLFWRDNGDVIDVITIQKSQWNDSTSARFTINLGLYWKQVQALVDRAVPLPREYDCTVQTRIGGLLPERTDLWWEVADSEVSVVARDVTEKLEQYGLPWLENGHTIERTMEYLEQRSLKAWRDKLMALRQQGKIQGF